MKRYNTKISSKLQTEIVEYLWLEKQNFSKNVELTKDSPKNDLIYNCLMTGKRQGIDYAIAIINNWNKLNKGKVSVHLN